MIGAHRLTFLKYTRFLFCRLRWFKFIAKSKVFFIAIFVINHLAKVISLTCFQCFFHGSIISVWIFTAAFSIRYIRFHIWIEPNLILTVAYEKYSFLYSSYAREYFYFLNTIPRFLLKNLLHLIFKVSSFVQLPST